MPRLDTGKAGSFQNVSIYRFRNKYEIKSDANKMQSTYIDEKR